MMLANALALGVQRRGGPGAGLGITALYEE